MIEAELAELENAVHRETVRARLDIEQKYRQAQISKQRLEIATGSRDAAKTAWDKTKRKQALGEAGELEILAAELGLKRAETELTQLSNRYSQDRNSLADTLGLTEEFELEALPSAPDTIELPTLLPFPEIRELCVANSTTLAALHRQLLDSQFALEQAREKLKPSLTTSISLNGSSVGEKDLRAEIHISYPLADGHLRQTRMERSKQSLKQVEEDYRNALDNLNRQVERLVGEVLVGQDQQEIARLDYQRTHLEYVIAEQQYEKGLIDGADLKAKQLAQATAQTALLESTFDLQLMITAINHGIIVDLLATGGQNQ